MGTWQIMEDHHIRTGEQAERRPFIRRMAVCCSASPVTGDLCALSYCLNLCMQSWLDRPVKARLVARREEEWAYLTVN